MKTNRYVVKILSTFAALLLMNTVIWARKAKTKSVPPASTNIFEIRNIEGWMVYLKKQDLKEHLVEMTDAIEHLQNQLYQIRLTVMAPAVTVMQQRVPIWMEYDTEPGGLSFHPSYKWLLERGYASPEGLTSLISNCRAKNFTRSSLHQPWVILHEMTESYFGVNDHYPFLQFETRQHDPETCQLLAELWGGKAK